MHVGVQGYYDEEGDSEMSESQADEEVAVTKRGRAVKLPAKYKAEVCYLLIPYTMRPLVAHLPMLLCNTQCAGHHHWVAHEPMPYKQLETCRWLIQHC